MPSLNDEHWQSQSLKQIVLGRSAARKHSPTAHSLAEHPRAALASKMLLHKGCQKVLLQHSLEWALQKTGPFLEAQSS